MPTYNFRFTESDIERAAKQFLAVAGDRKHFAFSGEMGAGKTTFIKRLCELLGTTDHVSSPTFAIINEYSTSGQLPIFHFDFYRIKEPVELLDIGFDEYCAAQAYCFIEWPEKATHLIPDDFILVKITEENPVTRVLTFTLS